MDTLSLNRLLLDLEKELGVEVHAYDRPDTGNLVVAFRKEYRLPILISTNEDIANTSLLFVRDLLEAPAFKTRFESLNTALAASNKKLEEANNQLHAQNAIILKLEELLKEAYKK